MQSKSLGLKNYLYFLCLKFSLKILFDLILGINAKTSEQAHNAVAIKYQLVFMKSSVFYILFFVIF